MARTGGETTPTEQGLICDPTRPASSNSFNPPNPQTSSHSLSAMGCFAGETKIIPQEAGTTSQKNLAINANTTSLGCLSWGGLKEFEKYMILKRQMVTRRFIGHSLGTMHRSLSLDTSLPGGHLIKPIFINEEAKIQSS